MITPLLENGHVFIINSINHTSTRPDNWIRYRNPPFCINTVLYLQSVYATRDIQHDPYQAKPKHRKHCTAISISIAIHMLKKDNTVITQF
jgi:hypothetical protein